jgi:uncharacterized protein (DUF58 family)
VIKINKAGYIYIVLTIAIGFSAVNTGNNLVYLVTSALLSYMLVSGIFGRNNIYEMDVAVGFPEEVFAQTDSLAYVSAENGRKWIPGFLLTVSAGEGSAFFPFVAAGSSESRPVPVRFPKRGRQSLETVVVSSTFPFNFFTRFRRVKKEFPLIVYPKPVRCDLAQVLGGRAPARGEEPINKPGYDSDILSIRNYVSGDPPKYISWKSTAKTGSLKTKELSAIAERHVLIDFDRMEKPDVERALSSVTYVVLNLLRSKVPVGLTIEGESIKPALSPAHKRDLLTRLALYGQS